MKWTKSYLDKSQNLTEKKYKLIFLKLWTEHKNIPLEKLFDKSQILHLSDELIEKKETSHFIERLFFEKASLIMQLSNLEVNPTKFLNEDRIYPQKINIAKKVYEEFSEIGLAAKTFITGNDCSFLLEIQDFKFNETDYEFIKNYIDESQKTKNDIYSIRFINPYSDNTVKALQKVIEYEDNLDNLMLLNNYCELIEQKDYTKSMVQVQEFKKIIDKKFDYIEMSKEMNKQDIGKKNRNKI
jgi:hypothetical protein